MACTGQIWEQTPQPTQVTGSMRALRFPVLGWTASESTTEGQPLWMHLPQAMHLSASTTRAGLGLRETNTQSPRVMSTETPS